ncbi:MAG: PIN domain nuclease [Acidobacteria bacterium]|nr:MAG: PIN domain nuclease [Acidobacteriota bacterium]
MIFVDTNVLVYAHDSSDRRRHEIATAVLRDTWISRMGVLSTQVLSEFYVVATRKLRVPFTSREARAIINSYSAWKVVVVDPTSIIAATLLEEEHSFSFWDALIIESAMRGGATEILSEDFQDRRQIGGLTIRNPFK